MKSNPNVAKVATDMTVLQFIWSAIFMTIVFIAYILLRTVSGDEEMSRQSFLNFASQPSRIFMLVLGIISISSFLTFYVKQGVTRKDYFLGAAISGVVVSFSLMLVAGIIHAVVALFVPTIEISSLLGPETFWLWTALALALSVTVFYSAGWLIGAGFYRFGNLGGLLYVASALVILLSSDILMKSTDQNPIGFMLSVGITGKFSPAVSIIGVVVIIAATLAAVRATTRIIPIKMK